MKEKRCRWWRALCERVKKCAKVLLPVSEEDFEIFTPFVLPMRTLECCGMLVTKETRLRGLFFYALVHIVFLDLNILFQLLFMTREVKSFEDFAVLMCILPSNVVVSAETIGLYFRMDEAMSILESLRQCIDEYGLSETFKRNLMRVDRNYKIYYVYVLLTAATVSFFGGFTSEGVYKMWSPLDLNNSVEFSIFYSYQVLTTFTTGMLSITIDIFPVLIIVYVTEMLKQLKAQIEALKPCESSREDLIRCVEYHVKIIGITRQLSKTFSLLFFMRGFFAMTVLCLIAFPLATATEFSLLSTFSSYIFIVMSTLAIPCYFGSKATELSSRICDSLFHSDWTGEDLEYRKMIRFAVDFSKRPTKITAFDYFSVDLETYKMICEASYSLYCMCKNLTKN